jgi:hypothetical protein
MRQVIVGSLLLILGVAALWAAQETPCCVVETEAITKAVLAANDKFIQAANSMDADAFFETIIGNEPGCIISDGKVYANREDALVDVRMGFESVQAMTRTYDQTHVTVLSATTALFTGKGKSHVSTYSGRTIDSPFAVSLVFVLKEGQWQVLHGHFSMPNPRP